MRSRHAPMPSHPGERSLLCGDVRFVARGGRPADGAGRRREPPPRQPAGAVAAPRPTRKDPLPPRRRGSRSQPAASRGHGLPERRPGDARGGRPRRAGHPRVDRHTAAADHGQQFALHRRVGRHPRADDALPQPTDLRGQPRRRPQTARRVEAAAAEQGKTGGDVKAIQANEKSLDKLENFTAVTTFQAPRKRRSSATRSSRCRSTSARAGSRWRRNWSACGSSSRPFRRKPSLPRGN